ncbi:GNAT family N-acetyltransferase [Companilactobacillus zhongbaensis]|uniref:GNAT family N-acetyltransferase n=1 Tax=Companilactobacillus zhongbaensis TaxID=2486009 RepID=UPI00177B12CB|nr:GNAT family N-acetyltransferase [Companilactobacillus zhongbaensis]
MIIRPIQKSDNQTIKHILQTDLKEAHLDIPGTAYFDDNLDTLNDFYDDNPQRGYFVVVDDDGQVVGGAGFAEFDLDAGIAELQKLYLDKSATGHGLSYRLIDTVEKHAKEAGYKKLYIETHHNLKAAIHIYPKAGFTRLDGPIKQSHHSGAMDGFYVKDI